MTARHEFAAMGTTVVVHTADLDRVRSVFGECESTFSRFLPDSELSRLNRLATTDGVDGLAVSEMMADVLDAAVVARERTEGLVDIAVGSAVEAWGYDVTFSEVRPRSTSPGAVPPGDWHFESGRLWLAPGTRLDLGGIAKGWTVDHVVESGLATFASAGGDLRSEDPGLLVEVEDAPGSTVAEVAVGVGALATSSTVRRRWRVADRDAHHVIDPTTGRPVVSPIRTATVVAQSAVDAEVGAKAVLLNGVEGLAWADRQPWIVRALAVWHDGSVYATPGRRAA